MVSLVYGTAWNWAKTGACRVGCWEMVLGSYRGDSYSCMTLMFV